MIRKTSYLLLLLLMLFNIKPTCNAQSVNDLEKRVNKLQADIKISQNLLNQISQDKKITIQQIELLQVQINKRDVLIKTYKAQIDALNDSIKLYKNNKVTLENDLKKTREDFAKLLVITNNNRSKLNNLLYVFSSDDFDQAVKRADYLKRINNMLKEKINDIKDTKEQIIANINTTEADKKRIETLLTVQKKEKNELEKDKKKLNNDIAKFNKQEKNIIQDIAKKQKESDNLQKKIKDIIAKEMEARKANAAVDTKLSANFKNNKGKLPWPVASGIVSKKYGSSTHPTQSKVTVFNNGIDISTNKGAEALCVFNGQVTNVFNTGTTNVVLVRHGMYFTLYANLDNVYVKTGDNVSTGQKLGVIHTVSGDNTTTLHFELWYEKNHTNPEVWMK